MRRAAVLAVVLLVQVEHGSLQLNANVSEWLKNVTWDVSKTTTTTDGTVPECVVKGKPAICTSLFSCKMPQEPDPTNKLFDYRIAGCVGKYDVCCYPEDVEATSESTTSSTTSSTTTSTTKRTSTESPRALGCGASRPGGYRTHIVEFSEYSEYPWVVALIKSRKVVGAGSIIHPSVVLTASHKIENTNPNEWTIRAGEWDQDIKKLINNRQDKQVRKIVMHDNRKLSLVGTSAALMFLKSSFDISADTPHVGIACLFKDPPKVGVDCDVMGWGAVNFNDTDYSRRLKKTVVPIVSHDRCTEQLRRTRLGSRFDLHESFTCAGGKKAEDACKGDGGAPLACPISDDGLRFAVAGVVAWGIGCGDQNRPGVYIDVPYYYEWIATQMINEGLDTTAYNY